MAIPNISTPYPGSGTATDYCRAFPSFPVGVSNKFSNETIFMEDKASYSFQNTTVMARRFKLRFENQTATERADFQAFHGARFGSYGTFYFNNYQTGENDIKVKFASDEIDYSHNTKGLCSWSCELVEVL